MSEKITLIESSPFGREIQWLTNKFQVTRFDKVFRTTKIVTERASSNQDVPRRQSELVPRQLVDSPPTTYATRVATATAPAAPYSNSANGTIPGIAAHTEQQALAGSKSSRSILQNAKGERVDKNISGINQDLVTRLKTRKLCNKYHLTNNCEYGGDCTHDHKSKLNPIELNHLRYVARFSACTWGLGCEDPNCCSGHRCQGGRACKWWKDGNCKFSDDMHKVDMAAVREVEVPAWN